MFETKPEIKAEPVVEESSADLIVFDDAPVVVSEEVRQEPVMVSEIKDETFAFSSLLAQANEEVKTEKQAPSFFAEETITPVKSEQKEEINFFDTPVADVPVAKIEEVKPLEDPNSILEASIVRLESLNANHDLVKQGKESEIEAKNVSITELNKQISALKKEITGLNKEIDKIDQDKARVADMIKLFQSQKAA